MFHPTPIRSPRNKKKENPHRAPETSFSLEPRVRTHTGRHLVRLSLDEQASIQTTASGLISLRGLNAARGARIRTKHLQKKKDIGMVNEKRAPVKPRKRGEPRKPGAPKRPNGVAAVEREGRHPLRAERRPREGNARKTREAGGRQSWLMAAWPFSTPGGARRPRRPEA